MRKEGKNMGKANKDKGGRKLEETTAGTGGQGGRKAAWRAKGTGSLERHGRTWRAVWWVDGKRFVRSTGTSIHREAVEKLKEFVAPYRLKTEAGKDAKAAKKAKAEKSDATAEALANAAKDKLSTAGKLEITLAKAWEEFDTSLARKTRTANVDRINLARWKVFQRWMHNKHPTVTSLADVKAYMAADFMKTIRKERSPKTFNDYRALLFQIWKVLDEAAGLDGFNPWDQSHIKAMEYDTDENTRRELTVEELARVVAPLTGEMRVLFALGIYTGLRLGDCVNLDWGKVDLVRGFIQCKPRKTKKGKIMVHIPLFPALAKILLETPAEGRHGPILPHLSKTYGRYTCVRVRKAFEAAGIQTCKETGRKRKAVEVGFHSLRHTFVSLCANKGIPLHVVQAIVGHSNVKMTKHYTHLSDATLQGAVAVLPDVFTPTAAAALPAHVEDAEVGEVVAEECEAVEMVPGSVAKVARMLDGCSPAVLAKAEKMIEKLLAKEGKA